MSGFDFSEQAKPLGQALALESAARIRAEVERDVMRELLQEGIEWSAPLAAAQHELGSLEAWQTKARAAVERAG